MSAINSSEPVEDYVYDLDPTTICSISENGSSVARIHRHHDFGSNNVVYGSGRVSARFKGGRFLVLDEKDMAKIARGRAKPRWFDVGYLVEYR